jgi:hypothetical protein
MRSTTFVLLLVGSLTFATPADALFIQLTRFGPCPPIPSPCVVVIDDGDPEDLNPAPGIIDFVTSVGALPDGVFEASGTLIETITGDPANPTSILLTLTNASVQGTAGGFPPLFTIPGQINVFSTAAIKGGTGFVSAQGQYQHFNGDQIGFADITFAAASIGGCVLGTVDPQAAAGVAGLVPFNASAGGGCGFPSNNLLIGTLTFAMMVNDGFVLPASAEFYAAVPEPASWLMFLSSAGAVVIRRRAARRPGRCGNGWCSSK